MNSFLVRASRPALATVICLAALAILPSRANEGPAPPPSSSAAAPWSANLRESIDRYAGRERSVQAELRRGVERLTKACIAPTPSVAISQPMPSNLLEQELRDLDRLLNPLSERTQRLLAQAEQRREQLCPFLPLMPKNAACRQAEDRRDSLKLLSTALVAQRTDLSARYNLFAEAGRLEARGCTSPGFTQRLLRADDQHVKPNSSQSLSDWARLLNAAEANTN